MTALALALLLGGYALLMLTNPVRGSLRNGWRCLRRYPVLWRALALLGIAYALFNLALELAQLRHDPTRLVWARPGLSDPAVWLHGTPDSLWWLPPDALRESLSASLLPALESLAGLFNHAVTTFPIAVCAALAFFFNLGGMFRMLRLAAVRRFGVFGWVLLAFVAVCALSALLKPLLYFYPILVPPEIRAQWLTDADWYRWGALAQWPATLFEYLFGLAVQAYLILHAYAWVRGITFEPYALREIAIRRLGASVKWAAWVMLAQSLLIDLPLALAFAFRPEQINAALQWQEPARFVLSLALLLCASLQAWLTLHGETLGRAFRSHLRLLRRHIWEMFWFLLVAGLHLFTLQFLRTAVLRGLGEKTAPGLGWTLVWPCLAGLVIGWLLASWICLFKRLEERDAKPPHSASALP